MTEALTNRRIAVAIVLGVLPRVLWVLNSLVAGLQSGGGTRLGIQIVFAFMDGNAQ